VRREKEDIWQTEQLHLEDNEQSIDGGGGGRKQLHGSI
jgi:hypothetical protein